MYEQSLRYEKNFDTKNAFKSLEKAAKLGHPEAQYKLGFAYENSRLGLKQDYKQAAKYYRMSAEQGNLDAMFGLAKCYCFGNQPDGAQESLRWFTKAANAGHASSRVELFFYYMGMGCGGHPNYDSAEYWMEAAYSCGTLSEGDRKLLEGYEKKADMRLFSINEPPKWSDAEKQQRAKRAQELYEKGLSSSRGKDRDTAAMFRYYTEAAELNHGEAQNNLAILYNTWSPVKDSAKAIRLHVQSAYNGVPEAMYNLAIIYMNGRGVPVNKRKALRWMTRAAEKKFGLAQYRLAYWYLNRKEMQDLDKAQYWASQRGIMEGAKVRQDKADLLESIAAAREKADKR